MQTILQKIYSKIRMFRLPKTYLFFALALLCAISHHFSYYLYLVLGTVILLLFLKKPSNLIATFLFIVINIISSHFFIAVDVADYKNYTFVKTPSAKLYLEKGTSLQTGDLITGTFQRDISKSKFFYKTSFITKEDVKISKIPIVSKIMEYRDEQSHKMFFSSGGLVHTAQALIFGDRSFIPETLKDAYTISGLSHLLSMSGAHVAIIVAIFLTSLFFLPLKFRMFFAIFGVLLITVFGVFNITVVRAAVFSLVFMICYILDFRADSKKFLLFMMGIFMIFSPLIITDISFLLSFGAVFGIIYMVKSGRNVITAGLLTGIAATLITAPLAMYVFGMTNHLSVISTIFISPIIYFHILFALLYLVFPSICLPPLIFIEQLSNASVEFFANASYFGFVLKTIPLWLLLLCVVFTIVCLTSRYKWAAMLCLLVIFYPSPKPPQLIFPALTGANKGFLSFQNGRSEIFYQGSPSGFKYVFLPLTAKYGVKVFDYGDIRIFGGQNGYIRIKTIGREFSNICLNEKNKECEFFYHTRSNSVTKKSIDNKTLHIVYKNKLEDKSIYTLSATGDIIVQNGEIIFNDKNKSE